MGDIASAIAEAIRNRATSTTLATYSFFWIAWHWQGMVTVLFVSEEMIFEKSALLKNEFVNQYFFGWHGLPTFMGFVGPLALTVLFIWPFQKFIFIHAYRLEQEARTARRKVRLKNERDLEKYRAQLLAQESKNIDAQAKKVEAEAKLSRTRQRAAKTDPTILWDDDYESFRQSRFFRDFAAITEAIYKHSGSYNLYSFEDGIDFHVAPELLAFADTEELVSIDQKAQKITLTPKGKYFIKKYQQESV